VARTLAVALVVLLAAPARATQDAVERRFQDAKAEASRLKKDRVRAKFRHNWERVIERFESVAKKAPRHARAPDALFDGAKLYEDLSRLSRATSDLEAAVELYGRLAAKYPRSRLADDALIAAARIKLERRGETAEARALLERLLEEQAGGDRAKEASTLLARLPRTAKPAPRPSATTNTTTPAAAATEAAATTVAEIRKLAPGGEITLSEHMGLKVRRVVVDAGHGGHDSGAVGADGAQEKDVALAIAQKLAEKLRALGLEVDLTRDDDRFVPLEERAEIANRAKADLFISVHCNAAPGKKTHGIETYTLDVSHDRYALRLAARENATTEHTVGDLQLILADLATKSNAADSERLADRVQQSLSGKLNAKSLGVKHALFFVLLGAKMPAILVETGFITHPKEGKSLGDEKYQEQAAEAIQQGVKEFLDSRERLARVD
jgi:N-acetylmuramoyl-L-alanine amidase